MAYYYIAGSPYSAELYHHGIKGQKWGIRRFQNEDGSLTPAGKAKYGTVDNFNRSYKGAGNSKSSGGKGSKAKTALKIGAGIAVAGLSAYGLYRLSSMNKGTLSTGSKAAASILSTTASKPASRASTPVSSAQLSRNLDALKRQASSYNSAASKAGSGLDSYTADLLRKMNNR